jgi:hypothetical protein
LKWKTRLKQIEELRRKHGKQRYRPFPDLSVEQRTPPCSNSIVAFTSGRKTLPEDAKSFPVGHAHKQGMQLITPDAVAKELQWFGGKKPN